METQKQVNPEEWYNVATTRFVAGLKAELTTLEAGLVKAGNLARDPSINAGEGLASIVGGLTDTFKKNVGEQVMDYYADSRSVQQMYLYLRAKK